ncbi:MAG: hypothetical protein LLG42_05360 [Chloroflexi bacterium]|nr:hypothetical protein [Chloroflexota bacterium]
MADIKCPVCGNENNELATECKFCGALLNQPPNELWRKPSPESMDEILESLRGSGGTPIEPAQKIDNPEPDDEVNDEDQSLSDFISRLQDFTVDQENTVEPPPDETGENLPDWLKELDNWQPSLDNADAEDYSASPSYKFTLPLDENILPQWLDSVDENQKAADRPETMEENSAEAIKAEVLADWLSSQKENKSLPNETDLEAGEKTPTENIIELPPVFEEPAVPENAPIDAETSAQPESVQPGSPDMLPGEEGTESEVVIPTPSSLEYPGDADNISAVEGDNLNEWLGNLQTENFPQIFDTTKPETAEEPSNATPPFINGDLSAWIEPAPQESSGQEQTGESSPFPRETLPEWMQNITSANAGISQLDETPSEEASETGVPEWLAGLQPLEENLSASQQPASSGAVEEAGPLAGIPGVLPVFEASVFFRKPPLYSSQVEVSEKQRTNAARLENMLDEEKQVVKKKRPLRKTPHGLIRALIGILLIGVMLLPLVGPISPALEAWAGRAGTTEIGSFQATIDALPEGSSVLVAVEYSPGYDGELSTAAMSAFELLMKRNAHIAVVSTNSSGPVLGEGLKNDVLAANPDLQEQYNQRDWFINLGYLPGETLSLQELVANPQQAVRYGISSGLENRPVWDSAGLINIQKLNDFSMLVLITDTTETGRAWIEQVQPAIQGVPFLVVSSAQAAPMLQPYVASGQVQGLVSGMAGGLSLRESSQLQTENSGKNWAAFQLGVAAVIVFILLGGIVEFIKSLLGRKRLDQEVS